MDFKKAFDSVSHHYLLDKLQAFGIVGKARKWFEAYLQNCYQHIKIRDLFSELCYVHSGVPQGSVLEPLLFVVFINDLPDFFQSATPFIFADDTKLLQAIRSSEDIARLQYDINSTSD